MPVPLVRRDPYSVAGTHPLWCLAFLADEAVASRDLEQLTVLVLVPKPPTTAKLKASQ